MRTNTWAIQISRSIFDSDIWHKPPEWLKIWLYILWNVNFKDSNDFKRWENFFRYEVIAVECKCSINTVNKCIKFLKEAGQIQNRKTTRGAIITVNKYDIYQDLSNYGRIEAVQKQNRSSTGTNTIIEEWKNVKMKELLSKESKPQKTFSFDFVSLDQKIYKNNKEFIDLWDSFKEMRKKIKAPLTEKAEEILLRKWISYNYNIFYQMIEQSIERGWRWIFDLNKDNINSKVLNESKNKAEREKEEAHKRFEEYKKNNLITK